MWKFDRILIRHLTQSFHCDFQHSDLPLKIKPILAEVREEELSGYRPHLYLPLREVRSRRAVLKPETNIFEANLLEKDGNVSHGVQNRASEKQSQNLVHSNITVSGSMSKCLTFPT